MMRPGKRRRLLWLGLLAAAVAGAAGAVAALGRPFADPDRVWEQARVAFEQRRFDQVEVLLGQLARLRKPTPLDWMLRAELALAHKRLDEAVADLQRVPDNNIMAAQARNQAAQIELRRNRVARAERLYLQALRLDPKLVPARRELVYIYGMQLRRRPLAEQFTRLSEQSPLTFHEVLTWGLTRSIDWEPAAAAADLARYVEADPADRDSRLALAENLRQLGRFDEATKAIEPLGEKDADARAIRALIALNRNDPDSASKLLAQGPRDHPDLERLRGRLALLDKDAKTALRHFQAAYRADPENRDNVFHLGQVLRMLGDQSAARPYLEKARKLDQLSLLIQRASSRSAPQDHHLPLELGAACEAVDRNAEAKAWYKLAIARDPLDMEAQRALSLLEQKLAEAKLR